MKLNNTDGGRQQCDSGSSLAGAAYAGRRQLMLAGAAYAGRRQLMLAESSSLTGAVYAGRKQLADRRKLVITLGIMQQSTPAR